MDWSKAKTILIVAFIITNLFILLVLINERPVEEPTITDEFIGNVVEIINDKGIGIDTKVPKDIPYLNTMIVEFEKIYSEELNKNYFNDNGIIKNGEGLKEILNGNESILIINNRLVIYENTNERVLHKDIDMDKAIEISEEFIRRGKFSTSDMKLTYIEEEDGTFYLEYSKEYGDIFVERTFTNFQIDKRGVKRFERQWLKTKELGETEIYISTAPKSLLTLLGMQEVYGKTITDISLCYYFDPERHEYIEEPGATKQGKAEPAWRIQFSDGYKVFID